MGNAILSRVHHGRIKIMKLDGQVMKVKEPLTVDEILKDYPSYVILHSDAVRHMGVKAKPLDGSASLKAKHLYFLVELPKLENYHREPRRVRSGINFDAKSRLESMLLVRRSISDISVNNKYGASSSEISENNGALRIKVRMAKAQLAEMMAQSEDSSEAAERIMEAYLNHAQTLAKEKEKVKEENGEEEKEKEGIFPWKPSLGSIPETCRKIQGNRVRFHSTHNGEVF